MLEILLVFDLSDQRYIMYSTFYFFAKKQLFLYMTKKIQRVLPAPIISEVFTKLIPISYTGRGCAF